MKSNVIFYDHVKQGFNGDFIPFYSNGVFHLFTIIDGSWEHMTTTDFVHYIDHGMGLEKGDEEAQDNSVCTGSLIEVDGIYHIFYAGYNGRFLGKKPIQVVLHATSKDLFSWKKEDDIFMPPNGDFYHMDGWRDPYIYYDEENKEYRMIITGEENHFHCKRWGAIALATSKDLKNWEVKEPLYKPFLYDTHECPDLFKMGDKWYLIFSTYTRWWELHYRVADSSNGPFYTPKDELLDNRSYYAAKTVSDGKRRFLVGWAARKNDELDSNKYEWGGTLCCHEVIQNEKGELDLIPIKEAIDMYKEPVKKELSFGFGNGNVNTENDNYVIDSEYGFTTAKLTDEVKDKVYVSFDVELKDNTTAGLIFRADIDKFDKWCMVEINRKKDVVFFDHFGKWFEDQYFDEIRPLVGNGKYHIEMITSESMIVIYCNGKALTTRSYKFRDGEIGLFSRDGKAIFSNVVIKTGDF